MGYCAAIKRKIPTILLVVSILSGTAVPAFAVGPFQDVSPGSSYTKAIRYAYDNRITIGTSEDTFSPDRLITSGAGRTRHCLPVPAFLHMDQNCTESTVMWMPRYLLQRIWAFAI